MWVVSLLEIQIVSVWGGMLQSVSNVYSLEHVEALAGRMVVHFVQASQEFGPYFFQGGVYASNEGCQSRFKLEHLVLGCIYEDIVEGISLISGSSLHYIPRHTTAVAHSLARFALLNDH